MNFDDYIQELLGNPNPKGNMLTGVSTAPNFYNQAQNNDYYSNPFRRQDSIDAGMAKKLADEQALARQLGIPVTTATTGMFGDDLDGGGGYDGDSPTSDAIDMGVDGGLGGPGGNTQGGGPAMSPAEAASIGIGLFGLNPLGIAASIAINSFNQPAPPTTNTPIGGGGGGGGVPAGPPAAVASPVDMSASPMGTPIGPMGDSSGPNGGVSAGGMSLGEMGGVY